MCNLVAAEVVEAIALLLQKNQRYRSDGANLVQVVVLAALSLTDFAVGWEVSAWRGATVEGEATEALKEALFV